MMKMRGSCCVALFLFFTSASAVQKLRSINSLKKINFGPSVPKHSLVLLQWFANTVDIDNNNVVWLTFDPNSGDYGSHHYGNFEEMLDPLPQGYRYYTIGNLHQDMSIQLPSYVVHPRREYDAENRDRIIFRVREQNTGQRVFQRIDQVYITQHYAISQQQGTRYDPAHTYQITTNLLRQIREFSVGEDQQQLSYLRNRFGSNADNSYITNTWGHLACLGLLFFIVIQEKSFNQQNKRPENNENPQNRPQNYNRPVNNNSPVNYNRPVNYNQPVNYTPLVNRQNHCCGGCCNSRSDAFAIVCFVIVIIVLIIIFLCIIFASRMK